MERDGIRLPVIAGGLVLAGLLLAGAAGSDAPGQAVFLDARCDLCHSVEAAGIEAKTRSEKLLGPGLPNGVRDRDTLGKYLMGEVEIDGRRHRKAFKGSASELAELLDWLDALARRSD